MANLYRPRTIALAKMAALPRYRHPADLSNQYSKPINQQMKAINGQLEFVKGLYHNDNYESLMKGVVHLRSAFRDAVRVPQRIELARTQFKLWDDYIKRGIQQLPEDKRINEKKRSQLFEAYTVAKERNEDKIACHRMLIFHNEYSKAFNLDIELHPRILMKMVHPHFGYMLLFRRSLTLSELVEFYHRMLFASEERYNGYLLHSDEITAFNFWKLYTDQSHLTVPQFCDFLRSFKYNVTPDNFNRHFSYSLKKSANEFSSDISANDQIIRFDFFRQIFLERGL